MIKMYGIPNCDSIKKAGSWLAKNNIPFELHDYKKEGITAEKLNAWSKKKGWEVIFNKRSTTWKEISKSYGGIVSSQADAIRIMQEHSSIIKRPVLEVNGEIIVGFDEPVYIDKILK